MLKLLMVLALCIALSVEAGPLTKTTLATKPNLIFILVDDLGWNGIGPHNKDVMTPTIDGLFRDGLELTSYYTYKVCAPARGSFLTGRYPYKLAATKTNFAYFWTLEGTNSSYTMFPKKLQDAGYYTAMVGKVGSSCQPCFHRPYM
jgi:arylsulfatase A-like enzyme